MLLHERQAVECRRGDDDLEVVSAPGPVDHVELLGVGKRALEELQASGQLEQLLRDRLGADYAAQRDESTIALTA